MRFWLVGTLLALSSAAQAAAVCTAFCGDLSNWNVNFVQVMTSAGTSTADAFQKLKARCDNADRALYATFGVAMAQDGTSSECVGTTSPCLKTSGAAATEASACVAIPN